MKDYIEPSVPYNESKIWQFHYQFYESRAQTAWAPGNIPYVSTSNFPMATQHAKMLCNIYSEALQKHDLLPNEPFYILEIGAGNGVFVVNLFKALKTSCGDTGKKLHLVLHYIVSDYHQQTVLGAVSNPELKKLGNQIIPALFDMRTGELTTLNHKPLKLPIFVVYANYVACVSKTKLFKNEHNQLHEQYVQLQLTEHDFTESLELAGQKNILNHLPFKKEWRAVRQESNTLPKADQTLLQHYSTHTQARTFAFPYEFYGILRKLPNLLVANGYISINDFGVSANEEDAERTQEMVHYYGNTLNHPVQFGLLRQFVKDNNWAGLFSTDAHRSMHHAYLRCGESIEKSFLYAFQTHIDTCYNGEDFYIFNMLASEALAEKHFERALYFSRRCLRLSPDDEQSQVIFNKAKAGLT